jgi:hypothetical protein
VNDGPIAVPVAARLRYGLFLDEVRSRGFGTLVCLEQDLADPTTASVRIDGVVVPVAAKAAWRNHSIELALSLRDLADHLPLDRDRRVQFFVHAESSGALQQAVDFSRGVIVRF